MEQRDQPGHDEPDAQQDHPQVLCQSELTHFVILLFLLFTGRSRYFSCNSYAMTVLLSQKVKELHPSRKKLEFRAAGAATPRPGQTELLSRLEN
jgi:hypothetical protein